jgi:hypothetical protein
MSVLAIDGSRYTLPATDELRREFDPGSGLQNPGKGHYPQCLVSTLYDVNRRFPLARTVMPIEASEREEAIELLSQAPADSLVLFDRGYPGFAVLRYLLQEFHGHSVVRCPANSTFPAVARFVASGRREDTIRIEPTIDYKRNLDPQDRKGLCALTLRCIRMDAPDDSGTVSVLLTDLLDTEMYPREEIIDLYRRRWKIEEHYRDEKILLEIETFHGRTSNSIRQELHAAMIVTVIARTMAAIAEQEHPMGEARCQAKNAVLTLASEAAMLTPDDPGTASTVFKEALEEMARVKYYPPRIPRPSQIRVSKKPINKWQRGRLKICLSP